MRPQHGAASALGLPALREGTGRLAGTEAEVCLEGEGGKDG